MRTKTDSSVELKSQSIISIDGIPHLELTAETYVYPLTVSRAGREYRVYFELRRHDAASEEAVLRQIQVPQRIVGQEMETTREPVEPYREFVDRHFVRLIGVNTADPEVHRRYLDANPHLKDRIFREGVRAVADDPARNPFQDSDLLDLDLDGREILVPAVQTYYDHKRGVEERIEFTHHLRPRTEKDLRRYQTARTARYNTRLRELRGMLNVRALAGLYDDLVIAADGYLAQGKPCVEANRQDWVSLMPLSHKLLVVDVVFEDALARNS